MGSNPTPTTPRPSWSSPEWTFPCHGKDRGFKSHRGRCLLAEAKPARCRVGLQHRCSEVRLLLPTLNAVRSPEPVSSTEECLSYTQVVGVRLPHRLLERVGFHAWERARSPKPTAMPMGFDSSPDPLDGMRKCDPTLARAPPLKRIDVGSIPTASTDCIRGVAATGYPPTVASRVQSPPDALDCVRAHDVTAACRLAMADVWVRLPLGALLMMPLCCNGSQPSWYGGSVGSTPTGGSSQFRVSRTTFRVEERTNRNSKRCTRCPKRTEARYANRYCGQAQTLVFVGSTPTRATPKQLGSNASDASTGYQAACNSAALRGIVGSTPTRGTGDMARSSNGTGRQVLNLQVGVRFPHGSLGHAAGTVM